MTTRPKCPSGFRRSHRALEGKTVVKLFTQEGVRELLVPSTEPNYHPLLVTNEKLREINSMVTKKDSPSVQQEKERLAKESAQRKAKFREIDRKLSRKSSKLNDLEIEAKEKSNYLLKRAWELRMEQEDDVKAANSLILKTKCQAIRDAQLAEREMIKKKLEDENKKMEMSAEQTRINMLLEECRQAELQRCKKDKYVKQLTSQIHEMHEQRILESEKIIQERKNLNRAMLIMVNDEIKKMKEDSEKKARIRQELAVANEQIRKAHELEKEEERLADLKVQEWMKQRAAREEAIDREMQEARKRKELETARLRAMQEKAGELQALQDEMAAIRRQEEYEREWRKKEREAAKKKKEIEEKCIAARNKQIEDFRKIQALEIAREKRELEMNMRLQKEAEEHERLQEVKRKLEAEEYREALLRQMNEKEAEQIARRAEELAEGVAMRAEEAHRVQEVKRVLHNKVVQLRNNKVPEMYVADILRQLNLKDS